MDHLLHLNHFLTISKIDLVIFGALGILTSNRTINEIMLLKKYLSSPLTMDCFQVVVAKFLEIMK
jgi:hypothetical protein